MISVRHKGNFEKTTRFLKNASRGRYIAVLERYAQAGVAALASATPIESGETANSWYYQIEQGRGFSKIIFCNSNIQKGVPIAIILQYGHGTGTGGWVQGRDYINPAIQPIFDNIANNAWREVAKS